MQIVNAIFEPSKILFEIEYLLIMSNTPFHTNIFNKVS